MTVSTSESSSDKRLGRCLLALKIIGLVLLGLTWFVTAMLANFNAVEISELPCSLVELDWSQGNYQRVQFARYTPPPVAAAPAAPAAESRPKENGTANSEGVSDEVVGKCTIGLEAIEQSFYRYSGNLPRNYHSHASHFVLSSDDMGMFKRKKGVADYIDLKGCSDSDRWKIEIGALILWASGLGTLVIVVPCLLLFAWILYGSEENNYERFPVIPIAIFIWLITSWIGSAVYTGGVDSLIENLATSCPGGPTAKISPGGYAMASAWFTMIGVFVFTAVMLGVSLGLASSIYIVCRKVRERRQSQSVQHQTSQNAWDPPAVISSEQKEDKLSTITSQSANDNASRVQMTDITLEVEQRKEAAPPPAQPSHVETNTGKVMKEDPQPPTGIPPPPYTDLVVSPQNHGGTSEKQEQEQALVAEMERIRRELTMLRSNEATQDLYNDNRKN